MSAVTPVTCWVAAPAAVSAEQLLHALIHDLRSPLTRLRFAIELARMAGSLDAQARRADREITQIDAVLDSVQRYWSHQQQLQSEPPARISLHELLSRALQRLPAELTQTRVHWQPQLATECFVSVRIENCLQALDFALSHALRSSPSDAPVQVQEQQTDAGAVICIDDQAGPLTTAQIEQWCSPLRRDPRATEADPLGLNRAMLAQTLAADGGRVGMQPLARGCRLQLEWPLVATDCAEQAPSGSDN